MLYIEGKQVDDYEGGIPLSRLTNGINEKRKDNKKNKKGLKSKKNRKKNRKTRKAGAEGLSYDDFYVNNIEIILFLIDFLGKDELKEILVNHTKFIDSIETQNLVFEHNIDFRSFVNDTVQWFLFDYNKKFLNSLLIIVKNTLESEDFFSYDSNSDKSYNALLVNICKRIKEYETPLVDDPDEKEKRDIFILLKIILRGLRMENIKLKTIEIIKNHKNNIYKYKSTIICFLNWLVDQENNFLRKNEIRLLLKKTIEMKDKKIKDLWITFINSFDIIKNCYRSFITEVGTELGSNIFSKVRSNIVPANVRNIFYKK